MIKFQDYLNEQLKDPEFKAEYEQMSEEIEREIRLAKAKEAVCEAAKKALEELQFASNWTYGDDIPALLATVETLIQAEGE